MVARLYTSWPFPFWSPIGSATWHPSWSSGYWTEHRARNARRKMFERSICMCKHPTKLHCSFTRSLASRWRRRFVTTITTLIHLIAMYCAALWTGMTLRTRFWTSIRERPCGRKKKLRPQSMTLWEFESLRNVNSRSQGKAFPVDGEVIQYLEGTMLPWCWLIWNLHANHI